MYEDVDWSAGMLVKPQHMQLIKLHNFYKVMNLLRMTMPYYWGIIELNCDTTLLVDNKIIITSILYVSKDGALIKYDESQDNITNVIDLKSINSDGEFYIFLANISINEKGIKQSERHHKISYGPIDDINNTEPSDYVSFICVTPKFLLQDELSPKYTYFPLIKLKKSKGEINIMNFTPPSIFINTNSILVANIKTTIKIIEDKLTYAREKIITKHSKNMLDSKIMHTIRTYDLTFPILTELKILSEQEYIRPHLIYTVLSKFLTCSYSVSNMPKLTIEKYDHNNISNIFENILNKIKSVWDTLLKDAVLSTIMKTDEDGFHIDIEQHMIINNKIYIQCELMNAIEFNISKIAEEIDRFAICSESYKETVCNMRIRGIKANIIANIRQVDAFNELFNIDNAIYFSLDTKNEYFKHKEKLIIMSDNTNDKYRISIIYPIQS